MITPSPGLPWAGSHAGGPAALAVWFQFRAGPERALGTSLGACPAAARQPQLPQGSLPGVARGVACRGSAPSLILSAPRPTPKRLWGFPGSQHYPRRGRPRARWHPRAVRVPWDRVLRSRASVARTSMGVAAAAEPLAQPRGFFILSGSPVLGGKHWIWGKPETPKGEAGALVLLKRGQSFWLCCRAGARSRRAGGR